MALRNAPIEISEATWDSLTGKDDPQQRYALYRLCPCERCSGSGRNWTTLDPVHGHGRCEDCRGEGRVLEIVSTQPDPASVGVALVDLSREGEWDDCPVGVLDREGESGHKWIVKPWLPSPRNVSDAARTLARSKGEKK